MQQGELARGDDPGVSGDGVELGGADRGEGAERPRSEGPRRGHPERGETDRVDVLGVVEHEDEGGDRRLGGEELGQGVAESLRGVAIGELTGVQQEGAHPRGQLGEGRAGEGAGHHRGPVAGDAAGLQPDGDRLGHGGGDGAQDGAASHAPRAVDGDGLAGKDALRHGGDLAGAAHRLGRAPRQISCSENHHRLPSTSMSQT